MKRELFNFSVIPSVVPADKVSKISICGNGDYYRFFDDVQYIVKVCPKEFHDTPISRDFTLGKYDYKNIEAYSKNGILEFEYNFVSEQEWEIIVYASKNQKKHQGKIREEYDGVWNNEEALMGINFRIYSVYPDLYSKNVFKGDMHLHSNQSDGKENPEIVLANHRTHGCDYCAITDHHYYDSSVTAKNRFSELKTGFTSFTGEEVHNRIMGNYHVVNFGGNSSVNKLILDDVEGFNERIWAESENITDLSKEEAGMLAGYKVITDEIRKSGGLAIFAHPYWSVFNSYNCPTNIAIEVFRRGYFDAFEVLGGCTVHENNLQTALYNEMRAEGLKIPVVGSTDCHESYEKGAGHCATANTVVFAEAPEKIVDAVKDFHSVAVESLKGETERVYGPFRLVKYTIFLLENYFPIHDRFCRASGMMITEYFRGSEALKPAIEEIEKQLKEFEGKFFGKC